MNVDEMNMFSETHRKIINKVPPKKFTELPDLTNYNLSDDSFFSVMMQQKEFCKQMLEIILDKEFVHLEYNKIQETLQNLPGYKSIRLDVYAEDIEGNKYNIEMQKLKNDNMPKRSRFYQGLLDTSSLLQGKEIKYNSMTKLYVIFITDFDIFGQDLYRYTFTNRCHEIPELDLDDGVTKIFLNLRGTDSEHITEGLQDLLHFIKDTRSDFMSQDPKVNDLINLVKTLKGDQKVRDNTMRTDWIKEEALEEGREKGIEALVTSLEDFNLPTDEIVSKLQEKYNLPLEQAIEYCNKYLKQ